MSPKPDVERATTAFRLRGEDGALVEHAAWRDLDPAQRLEAFDRASLSRRMEAAVDARGLSSTAQAVLARILG